MEWYDKLKTFLGFPSSQNNPSVNNYHKQSTPPQNPHRNNDQNSDFVFHRDNYSIFSDPLEIHRFFEHQMSEMLRSFGFYESGDEFSHNFEMPQIDVYGPLAGGLDFPQLEEIPQQEQFSGGELRDQFLKPGYEQSTSRQDKDLDGKLDIKEWGSVFRGDGAVAPYQQQEAPRTRFFGQSMITKTIRNADGSLETHHTVRDNEGNEEITITKKIGDKEHTVTQRRTKDGKEEIIENLVNLEEKDKYFPKLRDQPHQQERWPFFDKFFK